MEAKQWLEEVAENQNADMALLMRVDWGMMKEKPYRLLFADGVGLATELEESLQEPIIISEEHSHAGDVAMSGVPTMIYKPQAEAGLERQGVEAQKNDTLVIYPIIDRGRVVGIVTLGYKDGNVHEAEYHLPWAMRVVQGAVDYL